MQQTPKGGEFFLNNGSLFLDSYICSQDTEEEQSG